MPTFGEPLFSEVAGARDRQGFAICTCRRQRAKAGSIKLWRLKHLFACGNIEVNAA
jgi:hypothetical protein